MVYDKEWSVNLNKFYVIGIGGEYEQMTLKAIHEWKSGGNYRIHVYVDW